MRANIARLLYVDIKCVSVKAGTNEDIDELGRGFAVRADAIVLLEKKEDSMDIVDILKLKITNSLAKLDYEVALSDIIIEKSKDETHGDYASNVAMKFARHFAKPPRDVAF